MIGFFPRCSVTRPMIGLAAAVVLSAAVAPLSFALTTAALQHKTTPSVPLHSVVGAASPVHFTDGVPQEKVDWASEALRISWEEVPQITGLPRPAAVPPLYVVRDDEEARILAPQVGMLAPLFGGCAAKSGANPAMMCLAPNLYSQDSTIHALSHELTHQFVQGDLTRYRGVSAWYNEGLAEYVQSTILSVHGPAYAKRQWLSRELVVAEALRAGNYLSLGVLTTGRQWDERGRAQSTELQYAESALTVRALVAHYGMPAVAEVVRRTDPEHAFDAVFAETLGQSVAEFDAALEAQLRTELLRPDRVLFQDEFSDPGSGWRREASDPSWLRVGYVDGEYQVASVGGSHGGVTLHPLVYSDFVVEVDARLVEASEQGYLELTLRRQADGSRYAYRLDPRTGVVALYCSNNGNWMPLLSWTAAPSAHQGATNRLGVHAEGDRITLLLNGVEVAEVQDTTLTGGQLGLGVVAQPEAPAEARFSNLVVRSVD